MAGPQGTPAPSEALCASGHNHASHAADRAQAHQDREGNAETPHPGRQQPIVPSDSPACLLHSGTLVSNFASGVDVLPVWNPRPVVTLPMQAMPPPAALCLARAESREGCDHRVRAQRPLLRQHCALIS